MDWDLFAAFVVVYAATFVPMFIAGAVSNGGVKAVMFMLDWGMTIVAYVLLWYAMPSTWPSLWACIFLGLGAIAAAQVMKRYGYDPYGIFAAQDN